MSDDDPITFLTAEDRRWLVGRGWQPPVSSATSWYDWAVAMTEVQQGINADQP